MKIQAGIVIFLLVALVALEVSSEFRNWDPTPVAITAPPAEFGVTPTGAGQYVMRASKKIFYCVRNKCTSIQLIAAPKQNDDAPAEKSGD